MIEDVAVGGIVSAVRPLKTKKGDRDGGLHARGSPGRGRGRGVPRDLRPLPAPDRQRRAAAGARQVRARRRSSRFQAAELSPLETLRERLAKARPHPPAGRRTSRAKLEALVGPAARSTRATGRSCSSWRSRTPSRRLRVRADVTPQIRVRPSEQLVSRGRAAVRRRLGCAAIGAPWPTCSSSKNRSASCRRRSRRCRCCRRPPTGCATSAGCRTASPRSARTSTPR